VDACLLCEQEAGSDPRHVGSESEHGCEPATVGYAAGGELAAGQLRAVAVPTPELKALRDLVRAREDLRGDLMAARRRISKMLLRHGHSYAGPGSAWESQRHAAWLGQLRLEDRLAHVGFGE